MNGISSYSMWWVLIHEELWMHHGNREYLEAQKPYLTALLKRLANLIGPDGKERIDGMRFLDWPSSPNQQGVTAGLAGAAGDDPRKRRAPDDRRWATPKPPSSAARPPRAGARSCPT